MNETYTFRDGTQAVTVPTSSAKLEAMIGILSQQAAIKQLETGLNPSTDSIIAESVMRGVIDHLSYNEFIRLTDKDIRSFNSRINRQKKRLGIKSKWTAAQKTVVILQNYLVNDFTDLAGLYAHMLLISGFKSDDNEFQRELEKTAMIGRTEV